MAQLNDALFAVIDTETTGLDPKADALVEIACVISSAQGVEGLWATLVNPLRPITPETSAIHLLTDADVASAPTKDEARGRLIRFKDAFAPDASIAHNAAFDEPFVEDGYAFPLFLNWACTQRLARHVWPEAPTYKNMGLRFWRKLDVDTFGILPHRALGDALVTAALLRDLLASEEFAAFGIETVDGLIELSRKPIRMQRWDFGRFKDQPIEAADAGWIDWCLRTLKESEKPDLFYTLRLGRKEGWLR